MDLLLFFRPLTDDEQQLRAGLRSPDAFTARRCQIVLASTSGLPPTQIVCNLAYACGTVRNEIHALHAEGTACLREKPSRPLSVRPSLDDRQADALIDLLHHSPRLCGKLIGLWTLELLAEVCHDRGWTPRRYIGEAIRLALRRPDIGWRRAKHWITSPDPANARKQYARDRLIRLAVAHPDWILGFQDETSWSRLALHQVHAWAGLEPLRLVLQEPRSGDTDRMRCAATACSAGVPAGCSCGSSPAAR